ncbi:flagellar basal body P-ring formation chaperone FlgA [Jeongeupia naejangsanensis]|uniref:Flagella basal body P-ring formation protein FlgA n=1 Tax=Jeongeupia naejangsanensis TaxID=613195 RepID=A0ABS2BHF2_9NEIS|nr:flagellar basal body P-ring formation chaperone FlgA [Jeongeupia naejangsanensis]MBM3114366.1 flagellar basal body P-ring formation protein FlgA [Jeongeupia naejangsanensis]
MKHFITPLLLSLACNAALAAPMDNEALRQEAESWVKQQLANSPSSTVKIGRLDSRLRLDACALRDFQLAPGQRLLGNTQIRIRCVEGADWSVNLPARIGQEVSYYVAARPLPAGHVLGAGDVQLRRGDLADLPGSVVLDTQQAVGQTLGMAVASGAPFRAEMLRAASVIRQGQRVKLTIRVGGIDVSNEGTALNTASEGQVVRVRLGGNQILQGTANADGSVDVTP